MSGFLARLFGPGVAQVSAREAHARFGRAVVLDVRERHEFRAAHIPGSVHIPLRELGGRLRELDRGRPVIAVCRSGNRSRAAARLLAREGYEVENLRGGMLAWMREELPVRSGKGAR